ncbi:MAG: hypothetical protein B0D92_07700 [Spirochaeta sp. LUC14_002_19_P3]|nr:MAG: hypothetical protein B0D92_07700 [Spirochaeta sp. LUC14_002_19_P3]
MLIIVTWIIICVSGEWGVMSDEWGWGFGNLELGFENWGRGIGCGLLKKDCLLKHFACLFGRQVFFLLKPRRRQVDKKGELDRT